MPLVAAVSLSENGHPSYIKLTPVQSLSAAEVGKWAKAHLAAGTSVLSDGLACFPALTQADRVHEVMVVDALKPREPPMFMWVKTILGNLKTSLAAYHLALGDAKYATQ